MSNTGHGMQKDFFQTIPLITSNSLNHNQFVVKSKFKGLKRQLISQITET